MNLESLIFSSLMAVVLFVVAVLIFFIGGFLGMASMESAIRDKIREHGFYKIDDLFKIVGRVELVDKRKKDG